MALDNLTPSEIVQAVGIVGGFGSMGWLLKQLANRKMAWWYQVEERDKIIADLKQEKLEQKQELQQECDKWERLYLAAKETTLHAQHVTEEAVTTARVVASTKR
jgi:alkylated DNA nucleotide flippase Atl1